MSNQALLWVIFASVIISMLVLDLAVFNKGGKEPRIRTALLWSAFWVGLALLFNLLVFIWKGRETGLEFLTAYLVEESLSIDNLFVFLLIFTYFGVPRAYQHKVLFWGIVGVVILRGIFIAAGVVLIERFHWILYGFGLLLIVSGIKMITQKDKKIEPEKNPVLKIFRRMMPVTESYSGDKFFLRQGGRFFATPLFVVVLVVETTDVVFAVDSIPAVFGITLDPMIVYTSNIFAVLGLRSLFFALSGFMQMFHHLHYGLSAVLVFVGVKMLVADFYKLPTVAALGTIAGIILISVVASLIWPKHGGTATIQEKL